MMSIDPIGDDGRNCINACVKVSIFGWRMQPLQVWMYTKTEAIQRLRECFNGVESHNIAEMLPEKDKNGTPKETFDIKDIRKALYDLASRYPEEDQPDSKISKRRRDIDNECRKFVSTCTDDEGSLEAFSGGSKQLNEQMEDDEKETIDTIVNSNYAARLLSDKPDHGDSYANNDLDDRKCIVSSIDTQCCNVPENAVFPSEKSEGNFVSDGATFYSENYPEKEAGLDVNKWTETDHIADGELDHGSGFIIDQHHVITCKHVVDDVLCDGTKEVRIANDIIGELPCEVVQSDASTDLALLYCRHLHLAKMSPLQLAEHETKTGSAVFSFGYPMSHTGKTALLATGHVAGSFERYGREDLQVLICPVIHGHSGSPVISKITGAPRVVGVISQRHKKDIVTPVEKMKIEKMRHALSTGSITDASDNQTGLNLLVLKLYDALDTHCQFNYCNAVPGTLVKKFMLSYEQKCKEEEKARP